VKKLGKLEPPVWRMPESTSRGAGGACSSNMSTKNDTKEMATTGSPAHS
jgi:hypothetical protein